jgi:hypothetical protein
MKLSPNVSITFYSIFPWRIPYQFLIFYHQNLVIHTSHQLESLRITNAIRDDYCVLMCELNFMLDFKAMSNNTTSYSF